MAKPTKVYFTGVLPRVNGSPVARAQSLSMDPDLSFTEMYELGNPSIIEYDRDTPTVTVTINTNDYASIMNLRKMTGIYTGNVTMSGLEGKSVGIDALIEQDNVLKRTIVAANCFLSSISWNYDVGGVASENYTFIANNKSIYTGDYRNAVILPVTWLGNDGSTASGYIASGAGLLTSGHADHYVWAANATVSYNCSGYTLHRIWNDNWSYQQNIDSLLTIGTDVGMGAEDTAIVWSGENTLVSGERIFAVAYRTDATAISDISVDYSTEAGVASVRKGQVMIDIAPYGVGGDYGQWFRLQTLGVDADLSRTQLDELGNYYPFYQALPDPVVITINASMLDSDMEAFFDAAGLVDGSAPLWADDYTRETNLEDFSRQAAIRVRVYTSKDRLASELRKTMVADNIQVTTESFAIDVQDNARQTMTATTSDFYVSGADLA